MNDAPRPETAYSACSSSLNIPNAGNRSLSDPRSSLQPRTPPTSRSWLHNLRRPRTSHGEGGSRLVKRKAWLTRSFENVRRDSALVSSSPTPTTASSRFSPRNDSFNRTSATSTLPTIVVQDDLTKPTTEWDAEPASAPPLTATSPESISPRNGLTRHFDSLVTAIPTGSLDDLTSPERIKFSQRGSLLVDGKKLSAMASGATETPTDMTPAPADPVPAEVAFEELQSPAAAKEPEQLRLLEPGLESGPVKGPAAVPRPNATARLTTTSFASAKALSVDEEVLSRKVRAMYMFGTDKVSRLSDEAVIEEDEEPEDPPAKTTESNSAQLPQGNGLLRSNSFDSRRPGTAMSRQPYETAGGIEDWEDIPGGEVDRYGFIVPKKPGSRGSDRSGAMFEAPGIKRISTALAEISQTPRRKHTLRRAPSNARSLRSLMSNGMAKSPSKTRESPASIYSNQSTKTFNNAPRPLHLAANRLPHNRDRRWLEEASDMLTLPPGLAELAELADDGKAALTMKRKEWQREEKWRKMAKATHQSTKGGGMLFEFNPHDAKVISRTWKGIPDRWRACAWYSFLAASVRTRRSKNEDVASDEDLIAAFHLLQAESSADDVQIDCDVPRTINGHIMFRRRNRGGQRLLFRLLHAFSLYFPDTGYVQGMAALAATLLCYFDEEHAFVMLVRLWQVRGLHRLYQSGFGGLMEALEEFEKEWLRGGEVARKLDELGITSTAYGTRWYLTLFNYSIPFPAQLRVWDVFMLLGDESNVVGDPAKTPFAADMDVLHATSAALIDATREILLDSDFENAMKVLTSWIPVKDEDLLMKVAHAEWKMRKKRG